MDDGDCVDQVEEGSPEINVEPTAEEGENEVRFDSLLTSTRPTDRFDSFDPSDGICHQGTRL